MSSFVPVNGAPMTIALGIDDKSIKQRLFERAPRAIHLPIAYTWAEYGPLDCQMVYGNTLPLTYGDETLNGRSKFATHVTPYLNLFLSNANPLLVKRLVPKDIGPKASIRISVDVLEDEFDELEREIDGSFKRDVNDAFVTTGAKVTGRKVKFFTEVVPVDPVTGSTFGKGTIRTGTMTNALGVPSKIYPLFDIEAPHLGSRGNNYGFRLWAPTTKDANPVKSNILEKDNVYPYRIALVKRIDENTSSKIVTTNYGELYDDLCLKPDLVDTDYNKDRYINQVIIENYQDLNPGEGEPLRFGPFGRISTYQDNIDFVLKDFLDLEAKFNYPSNDLFGLDSTTEDEHFYRVNLFGLQQPDGTPYQTLRFDTTSTDGVRFTDRTDNWLMGASDGTMTDDELANLVEAEMDEWGDPNSPYQDIIQYPCSFFWDTGFPLRVKYKMGKFISQRKNTNVSISTYIAGERPLTSSEESARHIAIVERIRSFAESDFFATPTVRASIVSRSGKPLASTYRGRVPCNYELANMVSRLAAGQAFKSVYLFDRVPYNIFELLGDVSSLWVPSAIRNKDWAMGMMWPERLSTRQVYFPASRTVYKEDTSVLTSIIAAIICAEATTVGILCQKQFSGGMYTKPQLRARVEDYCRDNLRQRFAELVRIEPECLFTDADDHRGYSWSLRIKIYFPMMRTVETLWIEAYDLDDIPADSPAFIS